MPFSFYRAVADHGFSSEFFNRFLLPSIRRMRLPRSHGFDVSSPDSAHVLQIRNREDPDRFIYVTLRRKPPESRRPGQARSHLVIDHSIYLPLDEDHSDATEKKFGTILDPGSRSGNRLLPIPVSILPPGTRVVPDRSGTTKAVVDVDSTSFQRLTPYLNASRVLSTYLDVLSMLAHRIDPAEFLRLSGLKHRLDAPREEDALRLFLESTSGHHAFFRDALSHSTAEDLERRIRTHFGLGSDASGFSREFGRLVYSYLVTRGGRTAATRLSALLAEPRHEETRPSESGVDELLYRLRKQEFYRGRKKKR